MVTTLPSRSEREAEEDTKCIRAADEVARHIFGSSSNWNKEQQALSLLARDLLAFSTGELDEKEMRPILSRFLESIRARCSSYEAFRLHEERYIAALVAERISKEVANLIRMGLMRII